MEVRLNVISVLTNSQLKSLRESLGKPDKPEPSVLKHLVSNTVINQLETRQGSNVQSEMVVEFADNVRESLAVLVTDDGVATIVGASDLDGNAGLIQADTMEKPIESYTAVVDRVKNLYSPADYKLIGRKVVLAAYNALKTYYPKLNKLLATMKVVEDDSAGTLYVTHNNGTGQVELHYSTEFIGRGTITELYCALCDSDKTVESITDQDILDYLSCVGTFYFMHEMYHIVYRHLEEDEPVPSNVANYTQDSYINQKLKKVYSNNPKLYNTLSNLDKQTMDLYGGITDSYTMEGTINPNYIAIMKQQDDYKDTHQLGYYLGHSAKKVFGAIKYTHGTSTMGKVLKEGTKVKVYILQQQPSDSQSYKQYSSKITAALAALIDYNHETKTESTSPNKQDNPDDNSGQPQQQQEQHGQPPQPQPPQGSSSQDSQDENGQDENGQDGQGSDGQQQDGQDSQDNQGSQSSQSSQSSQDSQGSQSSQDSQDSQSSQNSQDSQSSQDSQQQQGQQGQSSDKFDSKRKSVNIPSSYDRKLDDVAKEITSELSKESPMDKPHSSRTETVSDDLAKVLKKSRSDERVASSWKTTLKRLVDKATGITIDYNPEAANPRIQGQFGREVIKSTLRDVIFSFDISGSMDVEDFKSALKYIQTMMRMGYEFQRVGYSYWTTDHTEVVPRRMKPNTVYQNAVTGCPDHRGMTPIASAIKSFTEGKLRSAKPDLIIIFTDGEFNAQGITSKELSWLHRNRKKIIWCIKAGGTTSELLRLDPSSKRRIVKMVGR